MATKGKGIVLSDKGLEGRMMQDSVQESQGLWTQARLGKDSGEQKCCVWGGRMDFLIFVFLLL